MPFSIDTTKAFKLPSQQLELVRAVFGALPEEESIWVEWKTSPILEPAGRANIARNILGLANRLPDRASTTAEGHGYILVGVEPGNLEGVTPVEHADLENWLTPYLGPSGPQWMPSYVQDQGKHVLLISVDPPRWGDPIFVLGKTFDRYPQGAVFVRRKGATHQADAAEHRALQQRLLRRADRVSLAVEFADEPPALQAVDFRSDPLDDWLEAEKQACLAPLAAQTGKRDSDPKKIVINFDENRPKGPTLREVRAIEKKAEAGEPLTEEEQAILDDVQVKFGELAKTMSSAIGLGMRSEDRSPDEYRQQVDDYLVRLKDAAIPFAIQSFSASNRGEIRLQVSNPTDRNFADVEVVVSISGHLMARDDSDEEVFLPARPRSWGKPRPFVSRMNFRIPSIPDLSPAVRASFSWVHIDNSNSARIRFDVGDLRPGQEVDLDAVFLVVGPGHAGQNLVLNWRATAKDADGHSEGSLVLHVDSNLVSLVDLIKEAEAAGDPG